MGAVSLVPLCGACRWGMTASMSSGPWVSVQPSCGWRSAEPAASVATAEEAPRRCRLRAARQRGEVVLRPLELVDSRSRLAMLEAWQSNGRCESMVKSSDLTRSKTANRLPATSIVWMLAEAARSWCDVPRITSSDCLRLAAVYSVRTIDTGRKCSRRDNWGPARRSRRSWRWIAVYRRQTDDRKRWRTRWVHRLVRRTQWRAAVRVRTPCGTPYRHGDVLDVCRPSLTYCCRSGRYERSQLAATQSTPKSFSGRLIKTLWSMVSKAAEMSRQTKRNLSKSAFSDGGGSLWAQILGRLGRRPQSIYGLLDRGMM